MLAQGRRVRIVALSIILLTPVMAADLYQGFQDPPRTYSVRPFWFWNGKLEAQEVQRQIREMVAQGVYGAYVHNRTGLETPYLSEEYFEIVRAALEESKRSGFLFGFVDEYEWPGGDARDIRLEGLPSRVLAANPEFRMRSLAVTERRARGPAAVEIDGLRDSLFAVAGRFKSAGELDAETLRDISSSVAEGRLRWQAPEGEWLVAVYSTAPARGVDGGLVDLLDGRAVAKFVELVHEQYFRRFGDHFGTTIDSIYSDHEGDYGFKIAWTPALVEAFQKAKAYDPRKYMPLLAYEGGKLTPKFRCDYLDVVSELYAQSYFRQVAGWAEAHRIKLSGHLWEESLQMEAAYDGDLARMMRAYSWPGVDSLKERGRSPRDFKVASSVAHFRGTRFTCENQGLQGADSYLDFQKMRLGTNMIAAWGADLLIPHAFNYNQRRIEYPPDWFFHQPYWKYFRHYADYARRLSYMNAQGAHVADVLLFQPTETTWAHSDPVFSAASARYPGAVWNNPLDIVNTDYTDLMNRLAEARWDYDVADSYYLDRAEVRGGRLAIGNESYRVLVLPPTTTVRRSTMRKIREFFDQGGLVVAYRSLPNASMEEGRDDPAILEDRRVVFGMPARLNQNQAGGKAAFVPQDLGGVVSFLAANVRQDVQVLGGEGLHLYYAHRRAGGADFYWMVNDSEDPRTYSVRFAASGNAEKWDAATGQRSPLAASTAGGGAAITLSFDPWDAYYVVFGAPGAGAAPAPPARGGARMRPIEFNGPWMFQPEKTTLEAPYARVREATSSEGERLGWQERHFDDRNWQRMWLARERLTVRDWQLIGPFPNDDDAGFSTVYPPEKAIDFSASYDGAQGARVGWKAHTADSYVVDLAAALGVKGRNWITSYAATYVYSQTPRKVQFRIAANNNAKLWVNGKNLLDWHIVPYYYEMREEFAYTREAELQAGWNEVLVKVSRAGRGAQYGFSLRVTDEAGNNIPELAFSAARAKPPAPRYSEKRIWYRVPVPATAVAVKVPRAKDRIVAYFNGAKLRVQKDGTAGLPASAENADGVLALETDPDVVIPDSIEFQLGRTRFELGSWTLTGLPYYSGSASYEREVELQPEQVGRKLVLDCGQVGSVAEVWVNEQPAGVRVWLPYTFDITKLVRAGVNRLKIVVTNSMANERAVENHADALQRIKINGLLGPVRIMEAQ